MSLPVRRPAATARRGPWFPPSGEPWPAGSVFALKEHEEAASGMIGKRSFGYALAALLLGLACASIIVAQWLMQPPRLVVGLVEGGSPETVDPAGFRAARRARRRRPAFQLMRAFPDAASLRSAFRRGEVDLAPFATWEAVPTRRRPWRSSSGRACCSWRLRATNAPRPRGQDRAGGRGRSRGDDRAAGREGRLRGRGRRAVGPAEAARALPGRPDRAGRLRRRGGPGGCAT